MGGHWRGAEVLCQGGSAIVGPLGDYLAGPLFGGEGTLVADLDLNLITQARYDFDPVGHYNRPDIFRLMVNESPSRTIVPAGSERAAVSPTDGYATNAAPAIAHRVATVGGPSGSV